MNSNMKVAAWAGVLVLTAGMAVGQVEYVGGLRSSSMGGATLSPPVERRLPVRNLGSSGEDGVAIELNSLWGGGVGIDLGNWGGGGGGGGTPPVAGSVRHKYKGWDGTVRGNLRTTQSSTGQWTTTMDFSGLGAIGVQIDHYSGGVLVSSETFPGPIVERPIEPDCPPPSVPTIWYWKLWDANQQKYVYQWMYTCADHVTLHGNTLQDDYRVMPILPPGLPEDGSGIESVEITGDIGGFDVIDPQLLTWGASVHGLGEGQIKEECDDGDCDRGERRVRTTNIGSSGQDGVEIKWPPASVGGRVGVIRGMCCWDPRHSVTAMGASGERMMTMTYGPSLLTGENSALQFDFTDVGDGSAEVVFLDPSGNPIGAQSMIPNSGGTVVLDPSWMCFPPSHAVYGWDYVNQKWIFLTCAGGLEFILPTGEHVGPVGSIEITPNSTAMHRLSSVQARGSSASGDIVVDGFTAEGCPADVSGDSVIDLVDFFQFLGDFDQTLPGADIDHSGEVDLSDFFLFLGSFDQGC